ILKVKSRSKKNGGNGRIIMANTMTISMGPTMSLAYEAPTLSPSSERIAFMRHHLDMKHLLPAMPDCLAERGQASWELAATRAGEAYNLCHAASCATGTPRPRPL